MRYVSTRGAAPPVSFLDAVLAGLAPDGGLYVPESWPAPEEPHRSQRMFATGHYAGAASHVLKAFAGDALDWEVASALGNEAYIRAPKAGERDWAPPWPETVTPLAHRGPGIWMLELFHGPSLSFKDVAMQLIGPLYDHALTQRDRRVTVVCATSGDTGGAAVEALKGRERIDLFVLLPKGRVSDVQRLFMTASGETNVHALEIEGDFDACQAIVKALFADQDFAARAQISGVNSINWARIVAQSVYFHVAAAILGSHGAPTFFVPTGNFGDAFSGYAAKMTGAPVGRIVLATNSNDILARAWDTGQYRRAAQSRATISPAMDIQVASNFERILFEALGRDGDAVRSLYEQFAQSGGFMIPKAALDMLREHFVAASVEDSETRAWMKGEWNEGRHGYLTCPHTAVALAARAKVSPMPAPLVTLATAHPAKFPDTVAQATGVRPALPAWCADLFERAEKIDAIPNDAEAVKRVIRERSRAWS